MPDLDDEDRDDVEEIDPLLLAFSPASLFSKKVLLVFSVDTDTFDEHMDADPLGAYDLDEDDESPDDEGEVSFVRDEDIDLPLLFAFCNLSKPRPSLIMALATAAATSWPAPVCSTDMDDLEAAFCTVALVIFNSGFLLVDLPPLLAAD